MGHVRAMEHDKEMSILPTKTTQILKRATVLLGIIIIPLLYSYLYLGAFWDPYSRLDTLPVAIVNEDQGAEIRGKERNLGDELVSGLQEDNTLKFVVTSAGDAKTGTEGSRYYATITIPSDFTADIATADTASKTKATIVFSGNEKKNYLACQILNSAVTKIEEKLRDQVAGEIVGELSDKLNTIPDSLSELSDGLTLLGDGSGTLLDGAGKLSDGSTDLAAGAGKLNSGAADLASGAEKAAAGADTLSAGAANAAAGAAKLASGASDLSTGAGSLLAGTKLYTTNMADFKTAMDKAASGSVRVSDGAVSLDSGIDSLLDGVRKLETSTADIDKISSGAATLAAGTQALSTNLTNYVAGVDSLIASVNGTSAFLTQYATVINPDIMKDPYFSGFMQSLADPAVAQNIQTLSAAGSQLKDAASQISAGSAVLSSGSASLPQIKAALAQIDAGLVQAQTGSATLAAGAADLKSGLAQLDGAAGSLNAATQKLLSGSQSVSDGAAALSSGAADLSGGTGKLADGAKDLSAGNSKLLVGADALLGGSADLKDGADTLSEGAASLYDGAAKLNDGIMTAGDKVTENVDTAKADLPLLNGLSDYASSSVKIESAPVNPVPNYGTAFAPYFLSLSLWVGALMILLGTFLDTDSGFTILSRNSNNRFLRSFIFLGIGIVQAFILGKVLEIGLGLTVKNVGLYYLACCLFSVTAVSIVQFFMVNMKSLGKFLCIVILILQLTSCAGTFPMETLPKFFNVLLPFMPMTYSVGLLREAISGGDQTLVTKNALILVLITAIFVALSLFMTKRQMRAEKKKNA